MAAAEDAAATALLSISDCVASFESLGATRSAHGSSLSLPELVENALDGGLTVAAQARGGTTGRAIRGHAFASRSALGRGLEGRSFRLASAFLACLSSAVCWFTASGGGGP